MVSFAVHFRFFAFGCETIIQVPISAVKVNHPRLGHEMGHPPVPSIIFGYAQALPATLGLPEVGWKDLRRPGRLSATSFLTHFFFHVSTSVTMAWA